MAETIRQAHANELGERGYSGLDPSRSTPSTRGLHPHEAGEGAVARAIERQTAKLPSDVWLWAAGASIATSLLLQGTGARHRSLFVGQWAPTFLLLGIYNKLVKLHGSD